MSKNNKNSKRIQKAREMSKQRQSGSKGPAKTQPVHGKKNAWWQKFRSYHDFYLSLTGKSKKPAKKFGAAAEDTPAVEA